ncbi:hypothetical protein GQC79_003654 [Salmonella enterica]|nr:hypothetical protein [Salmonella enterica]
MFYLTIPHPAFNYIVKRDDPSDYQCQRQAAHTLKQACGALPTLREQAVPPATGEKESGAFVPPQKLLKAYPQPVICVPAGQTATEGASEGKQAAFPQTTRVSAVLFDFQRPDWHGGKYLSSSRQKASQFLDNESLLKQATFTN